MFSVATLCSMRLSGLAVVKSSSFLFLEDALCWLVLLLDTSLSKINNNYLNISKTSNNQYEFNNLSVEEHTCITNNPSISIFFNWPMCIPVTVHVIATSSQWTPWQSGLLCTSLVSVIHPSSSPCFIQHILLSHCKGLSQKSRASLVWWGIGNVSLANVVNLFWCKCNSFNWYRFVKDPSWMYEISLQWRYNNSKDWRPLNIFSAILDRLLLSIHRSVHTVRWQNDPEFILTMSVCDKRRIFKASNLLNRPSVMQGSLL